MTPLPVCVTAWHVVMQAASNDCCTISGVLFVIHYIPLWFVFHFVFSNISVYKILSGIDVLQS